MRSAAAGEQRTGEDLGEAGPLQRSGPWPGLEQSHREEAMNSGSAGTTAEPCGHSDAGARRAPHRPQACRSHACAARPLGRPWPAPAARASRSCRRSCGSAGASGSAQRRRRRRGGKPDGKEIRCRRVVDDSGRRPGGGRAARCGRRRRPWPTPTAQAWLCCWRSCRWSKGVRQRAAPATPAPGTGEGRPLQAAGRHAQAAGLVMWSQTAAGACGHGAKTGSSMAQRR
jgi:hypothetical protein